MKSGRIAGIFSIALLAGTTGYLLKSTTANKPTQNSYPPSVRAPEGTTLDQIPKTNDQKAVALLENDITPGGDKRPIEQKVHVQRLPKPKQQSLWNALAEARHAVTELTPSQAAMERNAGVRYFASQPHSEFTVRFLNDGGVRLQPGYAGANWQVTLRVAGSTGAIPEIAGDAKVQIRHSAELVEWYENKPEGLEHGFTVYSSTADMAGEHGLQIRLVVDGMMVEVDPSRPGDLILADVSGEDLLSYRDLKAWDADGKLLPAEMRPDMSGLVLTVDDTAARYPLTIDPIINRIIHLQQLDPTHDIKRQVNDYFGGAVAASGDTVVVGARYRDTPAGTNAGCAYVFTRSGSTWTHQQQLLAPDGAPDDWFGGAVAIQGDTVAVGASMTDTPITDAGSAYIFTRSGGVWTVLQKIQPMSQSTDDRFGSSLALSGDSLVVGAPRRSTTALQCGSAYVFTRSGTTWSEQQQLTVADGATFEQLGYSVDISGDTTVLGTHGGHAYVFTRSAGIWNQQQKFSPSGLVPEDYFGASVVISGDTIAVGAAREHSVATFIDTGSVFVFTRSGTSWTLQQKLTAPDASHSTCLGQSLSLDGDTLAAGAYNTNSIGVGSCYVFTRDAGSWTEEQKLTETGVLGYGVAVALSGDTVIVGADRQDSSMGEAHVYTRSGAVWSPQATLEAGKDPLDNDRFGFAVALGESRLVVGASADDTPAGTNAGSAYVFNYSNQYPSGYSWRLNQKLTAPDAASYDHFGTAVALSETTIAVGAVGDNSWAGSAYVFITSGSTWEQQQKLVASDAAVGEQFGHAVALSGDTLVVTAPSDGVPAANIGAAYAFIRDGSAWSEQQKLAAPDAADGSRFGASVSLTGDTVVIGDDLDDTQFGQDSGSAYVFQRAASTSWGFQQKLLPSDALALSEFGRAVAMSDGSIVVGSPKAFNTSGIVAGAAYVFSQSTQTTGTWAELQKLEASDGASGDQFGAAVSMDRDTAMIGAWMDDTAAGSDAGSAYLFIRSETTWAQQDQFLGSSPSTGAAFGCAVSNTQSQAVVGSYLNDSPTANNSGTVDIFDMERITLSNDSLAEGAAPYTAVGSPRVTSSRIGSWDMALVPGEGSDDNGIFTINHSSWFGDLLLSTVSFDHEEQSTRTIRMRATNSGTTIEDVFVIRILDDRTEDADGDGLTEEQEEDIYGTSDLNPDDDGDGIPGGTEVSVGLDPTVNNSALVNAIQSKPADFGVDMDALSLGHLVLRKSTETGKYTLVLDFKKSTDLSEYLDLAVQADEISVNAEGNIEFTFESPDSTTFYRIEIK